MPKTSALDSTLYCGQFVLTSWTQLIKNQNIILYPHQCSTIVSMETYLLYSFLPDTCVRRCTQYFINIFFLQHCFNFDWTQSWCQLLQHKWKKQVIWLLINSTASGRSDPVMETAWYICTWYNFFLCHINYILQVTFDYNLKFICIYCSDYFWIL